MNVPERLSKWLLLMLTLSINLRELLKDLDLVQIYAIIYMVHRGYRL